MCTVSSFLFIFFLIPQITFSVDKEMKAPIHLYYELSNFYQVSFNVILHNQNHRLYVNSRDDNQLRGEEVDISTLQTNCGNKTYDGELILNPCGSIANSFFNDVYHLKTDDYVLNEHDIAWKYDRDKYSNPSEYDETKYKYLQILILIIIIDINHILISFLKTRLMISHQHHITEVVSKMNTLSSGCVLLHYRGLENYMDVLRRISQLEQSWKLKLKQVGKEG